MSEASLDVGYWLSSEEHGPRELLDLAVQAEVTGFGHAMISDHFHPWTPAQGHAPFVWSVLGGIAARTSTLRLATGVTAAVGRLHPAVVAHAAATTAVLFQGRFELGLGTGERLNEHVTGAPWPRPGVRRRMLQETITLIRRLCAGELVNHEGEHFTVEHAQLFSRPVSPPPILVAAAGRRSAQLAGWLADGMLSIEPSARLVENFEAAGGVDKVRAGQLHLCWAPTVDEARSTARRWWPNAALPPRTLSEVAQPSAFAALAELVDEADVAAKVVCGPDPDPVLEAIGRFAAAGFTRVYLHPVGPDQAGFFRFWSDQLAPRLFD
jgi:coenzyme F420-dependent glucose-6-phosphate dehydrogenase